MSTKPYYDLPPDERDDLVDYEDTFNGDDDYEEEENDEQRN